MPWLRDAKFNRQIWFYDSGSCRQVTGVLWVSKNSKKIRDYEYLKKIHFPTPKNEFCQKTVFWPKSKNVVFCHFWIFLKGGTPKCCRPILVHVFSDFLIPICLKIFRTVWAWSANKLKSYLSIILSSCPWVRDAKFNRQIWFYVSGGCRQVTGVLWVSKEASW